MEITVTAYLIKKGARVRAYYKNIDMPFIPYPETTLVLGVLDATRSGTYCSLKVRELLWREINETEKIAVFGDVEIDSENHLRFLERSFERSPDWKKW